MKTTVKIQTELNQIDFGQMLSQIEVHHQKFSGFNFFEMKFIRRDGTEAGLIQNKKPLEVKNLQKLG